MDELTDNSWIAPTIQYRNNDRSVLLLEEIDDKIASLQEHPLDHAELARKQVWIPFDPVQGVEILPQNFITAARFQDS